jgi:hypothetical protein
MPNYNDNRHKYKNTFPWEVTPAHARHDNPVKQGDVVYSRPAIRGNAAGLPRAVRTTTAPHAPVPEVAPTPVPIGEVVPPKESWDL